MRVVVQHQGQPHIFDTVSGSLTPYSGAYEPVATPVEKPTTDGFFGGAIDAVQGMGWSGAYDVGDALRAIGAESIGKPITDRALQGMRENAPEQQGFSTEGVGNVVGQGLGLMGLGMGVGAVSGPLAPVTVPAAMFLGSLAQSYAGSRAEQEQRGETERARALAAGVPVAAIEMALGPEKALAAIGTSLLKKGVTETAKEGVEAAANLGWKGVSKEFVKQGAFENVEEMLQMPFEQWGGQGMAGLETKALLEGATDVLYNAPNVFVGAGMLGGGTQVYRNRKADQLKQLKDDLMREQQAQEEKIQTGAEEYLAKLDTESEIAPNQFVPGAATAGVSEEEARIAFAPIEWAAEQTGADAKKLRAKLEGKASTPLEEIAGTVVDERQDEWGSLVSQLGGIPEQRFASLDARELAAVDLMKAQGINPFAAAKVSLPEASGAPYVGREGLVEAAPKTGTGPTEPMFGPQGGVTPKARQKKPEAQLTPEGLGMPSPEILALMEDANRQEEQEAWTEEEQAAAMAPRAPIQDPFVDLAARFAENRRRDREAALARQVQLDAEAARLKAEYEATLAKEKQRDEQVRNAQRDEADDGAQVAQNAEDAQAPVEGKAENAQAPTDAQKVALEAADIADALPEGADIADADAFMKGWEVRKIVKTLNELRAEDEPKARAIEGKAALLSRLVDKGRALKQPVAPVQQPVQEEAVSPAEGLPKQKVKRVTLADVPADMGLAGAFGLPRVETPYEETPRAVQEPSPAEVDVREQARDGEAVAERDTEGQTVAQESEALSEEDLAGFFNDPAWNPQADEQTYDNLNPEAKRVFRERIERGDEVKDAVRAARRTKPAGGTATIAEARKEAEKVAYAEQVAEALKDPEQRAALDAITVKHRVWDDEVKSWVEQEMSALKALEDIQSNLDGLYKFKNCLGG